MPTNSALTSWFSAIALGTIAIVGLSQCKQIDESFDCQNICEEFARCFQSTIDISKCQSRCYDAVEKGSDHTLRRASNECAECIEEKSCSEVAASCSASCPTVYDTFAK